MAEKLFSPIGLTGLERFGTAASAGTLRLYICSDEPDTAAQARDTYALGSKTFEAGTVITIADATAGRKVTIPALTGGSVTADGTATHYALLENTSTILARGDLASGITVEAGGSFQLESFDITVPYALIPASMYVSSGVIDSGMQNLYDDIDAGGVLYLVLSTTAPGASPPQPDPLSDNMLPVTLDEPAVAETVVTLTMASPESAAVSVEMTNPGYYYLYHVGGGASRGPIGWGALSGTPGTLGVGDVFNLSTPFSLNYILSGV